MSLAWGVRALLCSHPFTGGSGLYLFLEHIHQPLVAQADIPDIHTPPQPVPARRDWCPSNLPAVAHAPQLPAHPDVCQEQGPGQAPTICTSPFPRVPLGLGLTSCGLGALGTRCHQCHRSLVLPVSLHGLGMGTGQGTPQYRISGAVFQLLLSPSP